MEETFTDVYNRNEWLIDSGPGSTIEYNKDVYIPFLKKYIVDNNIKKVCDLGCGDFKCGKLIYDDLDISYYGYDCVLKNIIEKHHSEYNNNKYNFFHLDIFNDRELILSGDLCILKDILCHWRLNYIYTFLDYLVESKRFKHILIINCFINSKDNTDIVSNGNFHPLSCYCNPLLKYKPEKLCNYNTKEISVIKVA